MKVGIEGQDDPKRLQTVRRCVGRKMDSAHRRQRGVVARMRSWSRIRSLLPAGISAVEQPVPHEQVGLPGRGARKGGASTDHARRIAVRHV